MSEYLIKNGHVFDPVQGIKGDKADVNRNEVGPFLASFWDHRGQDAPTRRNER